MDGSLGLAIQIAAEVHLGQTDKAGEDYILHPLAVMRMLAPDRDAMIVGVLHDVLEDFKGSAVDRLALRYRLQEAFKPVIFDAIVALTHLPGESYDDYVERIAPVYLARKAKIKDLSHNMDPRRIPASQIVDKDFARWDKYRRALIRLERED